MRRVDHATAHLNKFGLGKHGYQGGSLAEQKPATVITPEAMDAPQEELANVVEGEPGFALDPTSYTQVRDVLNHRALKSTILDYHVRTQASSYAGNFRGVAAGGPGDGALLWKYVAVGDTGMIQTSFDGETWTVRTPASSYTGTFRAICKSSNLFVAVGSGGCIQTSPDGVTWTARTPAASFAGDFYGVFYSLSLGLFIAVGSSGTIQTSTNGTTWTARTAAGGYTGSFRAVWAANVAIAVGDSGMIQTSTDGINWTPRSAAGGFSGAFHAVSHSAVADGLVIAVGANGTIQTSPDGTTWTARTSGTTATLRAVAESPINPFTNNYYAAVAGDEGRILISHDATTWHTLRRVRISESVNAMVEDPFDHTLMMVGDSGRIRQSRYA